MRPPARTLCLLAILACTQLHAVDFQPRYHEARTSSGDVIRQLYLQGKETLYTLSVPDNAVMTADGQSLRFTFESVEGATAVLANSSVKPEVELGDAAYHQALLSSLPPGATDIWILEEGQEAVRFNGVTGYRYLVACKLPGSTVRVEVFFLNVSKTEQITFVTTAYSDAFNTALEHSKRVLDSLSETSLARLSIPPSN